MFDKRATINDSMANVQDIYQCHCVEGHYRKVAKEFIQSQIKKNSPC
jgi:hypothetical protein